MIEVKNSLINIYIGVLCACVKTSVWESQFLGQCIKRSQGTKELMQKYI